MHATLPFPNGKYTEYSDQDLYCLFQTKGMTTFAFDIYEHNQNENTEDTSVHVKNGKNMQKSSILLRTTLKKVHMAYLSIPFLYTSYKYKNISCPFLLLWQNQICISLIGDVSTWHSKV